LLISGLKAGSGQPRLTANLGRALANLGWKVLLIDGTGLPTGLSGLLPARKRAELRIGRNLETVLDTADGLFLLPFGGITQSPSRQKLPFAGECDIVLIDGPAVGTAALAHLNLDHRIDGVIGWLPDDTGKADDAMDALESRFGRALMGVVRQAA
jgi:Mrp family chromosome partitioning ATPase